MSRAIEQLLSIPDEPSRRVFLQQNADLRNQSVVVHLAAQVPTIGRRDADRALQLANLATWLAEILDDDYCRGRSRRALGHSLQLKGKLQESLAQYQMALDLFTKLKLEPEAAITLSGSLQPLILLGNYEEAGRREEKARKIFKAHGDELRLARLDANLANFLLRQDRFEEALALYRRAEQSLQRFDATDDLAIVMNNLSVCHISLGDFASAFDTYERLRDYSGQRHLRLLTLQADYNIAYLHFLQGEHNRAIRLYEELRTRCAGAGDPYHVALCDLDQAEIYLHLNKYKQCAQLAQRSLAQFQALKVGYEIAKAYTFLGLAACHHTDTGDALELFAKARELFLLEQNSIWLALIDLYRAMFLYRIGRWRDALSSVGAAQNVLSHSALKDKAALAQLLRSVLHLELGDLAAAKYWAQFTLERFENSGIADIQQLAQAILRLLQAGENSLTPVPRQRAGAKIESETAAMRLQPEATKPRLFNKTQDLYQYLISAALRLPSPTVMQRLRLS